MTLQTVRKELATTALTEQFTFRDTIEPIHQELVSLLLEAFYALPNVNWLRYKGWDLELVKAENPWTGRTTSVP